MTTSRLRLGQLLVDARLITQEALEDVLTAQRQDGRRLGALLVERGHISEVQLTQILSHQLSVPWVSLLKIEFSRQLLNLVPREVAERYGVLPIFVRRVRGQGDTLYIATDDPTNEEALRACGAHAGLPVRPMIAPPSDVRSAIRAYYGGPTADPEPAPAAPLRAETGPAPDRASTAPATTVEPSPPAAATPTTATPTTATPAPQAEPRAPHPKHPAAHTQTLRSAVFDEAVEAAKLRATITPAPPAPPAAEAPGAAPPTVREPSRPPPVPAAAPTPTTPTEDPVIELTDARRSTVPPESRPAPIPSPRGKTPRMVALTLLDGTTLTLPARPQRHANETALRPAEQGRAPAPSPPLDSEPGVSSALTARDLVAALRAVANGADASAILGDDVRWEAMFAALLSVLLKKHLIADWEFVEELNKLQKR